jgi:hypothetical protein
MAAPIRPAPIQPTDGPVAALSLSIWNRLLQSFVTKVDDEFSARQAR